jgi:hypothetical protein
VTVYNKPEHRAVAAALQAMDHDLLMACQCWFGGGTEIVLDLGEYRLSKDVDFLCADTEGYREIRTRAASQGIAGLFGNHVQERRALKFDQYGIRGIITVDGVDLKVEIVKEGRIGLQGHPDTGLGVPRLVAADRVAEKLLANADRCQDLSVAYRDAADLGMLALYRGPFTEEALAKAEMVYGNEVGQKASWALERLSTAEERHRAAAALGMNPALLAAGTRALAGELLYLRPAWFPTGTIEVPLYPRETHMVDAPADGSRVGIRKRPSVGKIPGSLDNPLGPAVVSSNREVYFLDGKRMSIGQWKDAVAARTKDTENGTDCAP